MKVEKAAIVRDFATVASLGILLLATGCGGGDSAPSTAANVQAITVDPGPANNVNLLFTTVTICAPLASIAMWSAMLVPSLAVSVNGSLAEMVRQASAQILTQVNSGLTGWLGVSGSLAVGVVCAVIAFLIGRRVLAKGG